MEVCDKKKMNKPRWRTATETTVGLSIIQTTKKPSECYQHTKVAFLRLTGSYPILQSLLLFLFWSEHSKSSEQTTLTIHILVPRIVTIFLFISIVLELPPIL